MSNYELPGLMGVHNMGLPVQINSEIKLLLIKLEEKITLGCSAAYPSLGVPATSRLGGALIG